VIAIIRRVLKLLIVEDEPAVRNALVRALETEGYELSVAEDGVQALATMSQSPADALVLDVMLPGVDGLEVARRLRAQGSDVPILMLTARGAVGDRVAGLDAGADDYLVKPFALDELLARLRSLARRGPVERPAVLEVGTLRLDPATHQVWRGGSEIALSAREFGLLEAFMRRPGQLLSRFDLLEHAWDMGYESRSNVVDVYIRYLREKIDRPFGVTSIETLRGAGYRLRKDGGS
jgi:two-component system OmpR family response regulator